MVVASAVVLASLGLLQAASPPAQASTVINFDNLPSGTQLTSQYAADGVTFGVAAPGHAPSATMDVFSDPSAFSAPNDVLVGGCGDVCQTNMWAEFSAPQQQVSMYLDNVGVNGTVSSTVNAYDGDGNLVASAPFTAPANQWQQVSVSDPAGSIIFVQVVNWETGCCPAFRMDNFSFTGSNHPDFALVPGFDTTYGVGVPAGGTSTISFTLRRFDGSTGDISFTHNILPPGNTLALSPNPDGDGDNTTVQGTITGGEGQGGSSYPVTITATDPSEGNISHTVSFPITVQGTYQLRVQGIEVTQGVQDTTLPARNPADLSAPVSYTGVNLIDSAPTVVRVFADAPGAPAGGVLGVGAQLTAYASDGTKLGTLDTSIADSPNEDGTGGLVDSGSATVPDSESDSATRSFEFLLPTQWEGSVATLKATLIPPSGPVGGPPTALPCTTSFCQTLASMTLDNIAGRVFPTGYLGLDLGTIWLTNYGANPSLGQPLGDWTRLIPSYAVGFSSIGSHDIGWVLAGCPVNGLGGPQDACPSRSDKNSTVLNGLQDYVNNLGAVEAEGYVGVTDNNNGLSLGDESGDIIDGAGQAIAVVDGTKPVTDVDHEIGHMLSLHHASCACNAPGNGPCEDWPPDQKGELNSIGLDITGAAPFPVVAPPDQWYDFMSYCAVNNGDPNPNGTLGGTRAWVSARNWNSMVQTLFYINLHPSRAARLPAAVVHRFNGTAVMRVFGFSDRRDGTHLTLVDPTPTSAPITGARSAFTVAAVGGNGKITASAPLYGVSTHADGSGAVTMLQGALPLSAGTAAAKLVVTQAGKVVATLIRPAAKPTLTLGSIPGKCTARPIAVQWHVTDTTKAHLTAAVDFSANGGTTWTEVHDGPITKAGTAGTGGTAIPRSVLTTTSHAKIRVRVSDGYNQVSAQSAQFCVAPTAPTVTITAPAADQLAPGGTVALSGVAFDGNRHPLAGKALTWRAYGPGLPTGGTRLGTGNQLVAALPAATTKVTLTATSGGRSATATEQATPLLTPLQPQNGWTGGPFGTSQPAATLISGIVHLRGAIATTGTNPVAFALPPALRPAANVYVPVDMCGAANGRLLIQPSGTVTVQAEKSFSSAQCFTSLDGASYVLQPTTPLVPLNGWSGAPFGTSQPAATLVSGVVHLKGALTANGSTNPWVLILPPAMRPASNVYVPVDLCGAANGRLFIQPDGVVTVEAENSFSDAQCFTSLDGASFALTASTPLTTLNGWTGAPFATSNPAAALVSGVVQLKGAIATTGTNPVAFTLPPGLRPASNVYVPADLCGAANGRLFIQPNGTVTVQAENSFSDAQCFTSLDGASFIP